MAHNTTTNRSKYSPWALVTGASSGIGEEFARQLAKDGFNVVLAARNQERLSIIAESLRDHHEIDTKTLAVDLACTQGVDHVIEATTDLDIGLLVNNAGTGHPGSFLKNNLEEEKRVIQLNCITPMVLAHHFGNKMMVKSRGGIIFVSSAMGYQGTPYMANYSASKAYDLILGESLHYELKEHGIDVLVISPGATDTPGATLYDIDYSELPVTWMQADEVVSEAMGQLGKEVSLVIGTKNKLFTCITSRLFTRNCISPFFARLAKKAIPKDRL